MKLDEGSPASQLLEFLGLTKSAKYDDYIVRLTRSGKDNSPIADFNLAFDINQEQNELPYLIAYFGVDHQEAMFQYDYSNMFDDSSDKSMVGIRLQLIYSLLESLSKSLDDGANLLSKEQLELPYVP